jgi:hypothetical protein
VAALQEKNTEVAALKRENARQAQELQQLKQQQAQQQQQRGKQQAKAGTAAKPLSRSSSPGSVGKASQLRVEVREGGDRGACTAGLQWVGALCWHNDWGLSGGSSAIRGPRLAGLGACSNEASR